MRYVLRAMLALTVLVCLMTTSGLADDSPGEGGKIRVLLTTGGHGFQQEPFYAVFDAMPDVEYTKAEVPKDAGMLKPGLEKEFDVIVMYDMCNPGVTPEQKEAFVALLNRGIGVVSLHHNLGAHRDWPEFRKIIGGQFLLQDTEIDGVLYKQTPWSHGEDLKISVVDKEHPITKGIEDFEIHDETYGPYYTAPGIHVLLKTDHPKNNPDVAWTLNYGKSRVFYLMLGHDALAYKNPNFRALVHRGIQWAAGR